MMEASVPASYDNYWLMGNADANGRGNNPPLQNIATFLLGYGHVSHNKGDTGRKLA